MLERISGAQMGREPQELVKHTAVTRFKKLTAKLAELDSPFETLCYKDTVAKKSLVIDLYQKSTSVLSWDTLQMNGGATSFSRGNPVLIQCLLFLANYEKISAVVDKFMTAVRASAKIMSN